MSCVTPSNSFCVIRYLHFTYRRTHEFQIVFYRNDKKCQSYQLLQYLFEYYSNNSNGFKYILSCNMQYAYLIYTIIYVVMRVYDSILFM